MQILLLRFHLIILNLNTSKIGAGAGADSRAALKSNGFGSTTLN